MSSNRVPAPQQPLLPPTSSFGSQLGSEELLPLLSCAVLPLLVCCGQSHAKHNKKTQTLPGARTELVFSLVAGLVLCCGSGTKTELIRQGCFSCCLHSTKASSVSHAAPAVTRLGVHKTMGGESRELTQLIKGIPHTVCRSVSNKNWEKEGVMISAFTNKSYAW